MARNKSEKLTSDQRDMIAFAHLVEKVENGEMAEVHRYPAYCALSEDCFTEFRRNGATEYSSIGAYIFKTYGRG